MSDGLWTTEMLEPPDYLRTPGVARAHPPVFLTDNPQFRFLAQFFGAEAANAIEKYVLIMYAAGCGAQVGVFVEGYDERVEWVITFVDASTVPVVELTKRYEAERINFDGEHLYLDESAVSDFTWIQHGMLSVWIVARPTNLS